MGAQAVRPKPPARIGERAAKHVHSKAVLRLRSLRASRDFDDYWQFHLAKEHERTHQAQYADGVVPAVVPPRRPHLTLVK